MKAALVLTFITSALYMQARPDFSRVPKFAIPPHELTINTSPMKDMVIRPGDRVVVTRMVGGYERGTYKAEVLRWTDGGRLTVRADDQKLGTKVVSPDNVKKL